MGSNPQVSLELGIPPATPRPPPPGPPPPPRRPPSVPSLPAVAAPAAASSEAEPITLDIEPEASTSKKAGADPTSRPPPASAEPAAAPVEGAPAGTIYAAGDVIEGKYRLTRIIGKGGMGAVWLAHNIPLDIDVALKLIRRDRTAPEAPGRLLQEARAAARLKHPSIVRVTDFGETSSGDPFIVMELLSGEPLSAILRRKQRLTPTVAIQTLLPVASALASAHGKGIVHRDLKPDNIFLVTDESGSLVPKVVDFGIAKLLSNDIDRQFTLAGEVLGSPDYMSPEQARGADNVGEPTDIWAFTVVLYEAITGKRPFDGPNYNALIAAILTNDPQPTTEHGVGDAALWAILSRGLTKNVSLRWLTMRELGAALAAWAVEHGVEDDVAGNPITKQWLSAAMRRILTVYPDQAAEPAAVRPAAGAPAAPAGAPAAGGAPAEPPRDGAPAPVDTQSSRRRRGVGALFWIGLLTPVVVAVGVLGYLARDPLRERLASSTAAPTSTAVAEAAPSATAAGSVAPAPPPTVAAVSPPASATAAAAPEPGGSARIKVKGPLPAGSVKKKAPTAPRSITF